MTTSSNSAASSFFLPFLPDGFTFSLSLSSSFLLNLVLYLLNRSSKWSSSLARSRRLSRFLFLAQRTMSLSSSFSKRLPPILMVASCSFLSSFSSRLRSNNSTFYLAFILVYSLRLTGLPAAFLAAPAAAASQGFFNAWIFFLTRCFLPLAMGQSSIAYSTSISSHSPMETIFLRWLISIPLPLLSTTLDDSSASADNFCRLRFLVSFFSASLFSMAKRWCLSNFQALFCNLRASSRAKSTMSGLSPLSLMLLRYLTANIESQGSVNSAKARPLAQF